MTTRASIFLRLKADDSAAREMAWEEFRDCYAPIIAGFAKKLSVKTHEIDDIIQDVMLGFFSQSPTFVYNPAAGRFRGYLKVCTFRAMQRRVGKSARVNQVSIDQVDPEHVQVEQVWSDIWEQQRLQRALDATRGEFNNNKTFQAFEQHVIKSKKVQDVMRDLDMSESSVHRARSRVAAALRRRLDDLEETEG